jgi:hypothetical protein
MTAFVDSIFHAYLFSVEELSREWFLIIDIMDNIRLLKYGITIGSPLFERKLASEIVKRQILVRIPILPTCGPASIIQSTLELQQNAYKASKIGTER